MSEVTDIRCAVSKGDLAGGASSAVDVSVASTSTTPASLGCFASPLVSAGAGAGAAAAAAAASGTGESALGSWTVVSVDSRLLMSDRDRDCGRSVCDSGRGVISEASSKLSYNGAHSSAGHWVACWPAVQTRGIHSRLPCQSCVSLWASRASCCPPCCRVRSWCSSWPDIRSNKAAGMRRGQTVSVRYRIAITV